MCDIEEEFPNFNTFKFIVSSEQAKGVYNTNLEVFKEGGFMLASIGTIEHYQNGKQGTFALDDIVGYYNSKRLL